MCEHIYGLSFLAVAVFFMTFSLLSVFGFVPTETDRRAGEDILPSYQAQEASFAETERINPIRIVIPAIHLDFRIITPESVAVSVLDEALTRGVVQYPEGGDLSRGNVFLFGHSSNLPVVRNKAYKVFTDLHLLKEGDIIQLFSENDEYRYSVTKTFLTDENEAFITFSNDKKKLTLSTCNTFGAKSERFIVEAEFVGDSPQ